MMIENDVNVDPITLSPKRRTDQFVYPKDRNRLKGLDLAVDYNYDFL
jgi:hypothetical protein